MCYHSRDNDYHHNSYCADTHSRTAADTANLLLLLLRAILTQLGIAGTGITGCFG